MTIDAAIAPASRPRGPGLLARAFAGTTGPVVTIVAVLMVVWYAAAVWLNAPLVQSETPLSTAELVDATLALERPLLPAPHQILIELKKTVLDTPVTSKRSLVQHAWVTLSSTLTGFAFGALLGLLLAVAIVHVRSLEKSLMFWIVSSQTIPILAVAPIIIVVLGAIGVTGLVPKAIISAYLCFFPVTAGMVKGLTSPDRLHVDLMRTYDASPSATFWKLRVPASVPFLFTSLKVAIAASLVGAIVGELPTGAQAGLGARLLAGSYYGQTIQIWAALFAAAALAATMVGLVGALEGFVLRQMGTRR
ncbi:ABC transporter permease subunit [Siculibacillus lacustris]|uniref:ABC transporter permease subunit n=1 Tax=Siculibacillus lacustris TaxID=1549641 RepID=A0A4Q9VM54_9HYPH|nr:ABC transporter permease subunit [Siculibacillus lacustris]TBW36646.1 ABC transporter permease subunit [Siculibacillus lacustris]